MKWIARGVAVFIALSSAAAAADGCRDEESRVTGFKTWAEIVRSFETCRTFDDGGLAEGYSVIRLLTTRWGQVGRLQKLARQDRSFEAFVLHHIDITTPREKHDTLVAQATNACPREALPICRAILAREREIEREAQAEHVP